MVHLLYPEDRWVSYATIEGWFADRVADNEIAPERLGAKTLREKAEALEDIGVITIAKDSVWPWPKGTDPLTQGFIDGQMPR